MEPRAGVVVVDALNPRDVWEVWEVWGLVCERRMLKVDL